MPPRGVALSPFKEAPPARHSRFRAGSRIGPHAMTAASYSGNAGFA
jgi:hypothetical protein